MPPEEFESAEEVDQYLEQVENTPTHDIPMNEKPAPEDKTAASAPPEEWEININGQSVKATRDKILQWAQMGYGAPNRIGELSQKLQGYEAKAGEWKQLEESFKPYREIDDFMKKNPEFWNHVQDAWKNKQQITQKAQDPNDPYAPHIQKLSSEVNEVKNFINELKQDKTAREQVSADQSLDQEVRSIREKYSNIDFDQRDAEGKSLEYRILEHAEKNGIAKFQTAFADFYLPNLLKQAEERGKETIAKDIQRKNKTGLLGQSPTPKSSFNTPKDIRSKSYNDIANEVLEEIAAGRVG